MMNTVNTELFSVKVLFTFEVTKKLKIEDNLNWKLITG